MNNTRLPNFVWFVFVVLCIVWGTTYFGVKVAVQYFPPLWFSAFRHFCAGAIFLILYFAKFRELPSKTDIWRAGVAGFFMISGGNALLSFAVVYIPSGLAGILSAVAPLYITLMSIAVFKGFRITWLIVLGLIISIGGIYLLSKPEDGLSPTPAFWTGFWLCLLANFFWGIGSIFMRKYPVEQHIYLKTALQMIPASIINMVVSLGFETPPDLATVPANAWWAAAYLIGIGSLIGYTSFVYLTKYMVPARLSIHIYVNTVVAVLVGWLFGGDHLTGMTWMAMGIILAGVVIVNNEYAKMNRQLIANSLD
jgi:drug/metabolite transporter (DMT)-like permease